MTTMLFYDKITPLNRDRHRKLRLRQTEDRARFAAKTHFVPLAGTEFFLAARDFPILFISTKAGGGPIALMGLRDGVNLFVEDDGSWAAETYVPAFVRRYPFVLARSDDKEPLTVCIDDSYAGFSEEEGNALFEDDGKDSEYLTRTVDFLNRFTADMEYTEAFVKRMDELELLITKSLRISDGKGHNFEVKDFRMIDEERLAKLDDSVLGDLHRRGWLGWIYAHLVSLGNVNRLPVRLKDSGSASAPAAANSASEVAPAANTDGEKKPKSKKARAKKNPAN